MDKIKIAHITSVHSHQDIRIFLKECKSLSKKYEVHLFNKEFDGVIDDVIFHKVSFFKNRFLRVLSSWFFALKHTIPSNYKIIHIHDPELLFCVLFWKILGFKTIYDIHEDVEQQIYQKEYLRKNIRKYISQIVYVFEKFISKITSRNIVVTDFLQKKFSNSTIIYNYPLIKGKEMNVYKKNQMCYIGNLDKSRGIELMSKIASDIKTKIVIAGQASESSLKIINGNKYLDYKGFLDQESIKTIMLESKMGLILHNQDGNHKYGFPTKLFEYMQNSLPMVVSNNYYQRKIITKSKCGLVVNIDSYDEVIKAIKSILFNEKFQKSLSKKAYKISEEFSWNSEEEKLINLYNHLLLN